MEVIRYIVVSLLFVGSYCSPISPKLDKSEDARTYSHSVQFNNELNEYFAAKIQICIDHAPINHGLLIYIQQPSSANEDCISGKNVKIDNGTKFQKRFFKSMYKTFKNMPVEQRIGVMSTIASAYSLPSYMTSAAQSWDSEQISKIKSKAAEVEVKKSKNGQSAPKPSKPPKIPKVILPPPPALTPHMKRSNKEDEQLIQLDKREKTGSITKSILHHASSGSHSPIHSSLSKAGNSHIPTPKIEPKKAKEANATVNKVMTWVGGSINLLYIPVAWMTTHKVQRVTDDDTHSYKKRNIESYKGKKEFTLITCIPIAQRGKNDFIIPKGALS